jgi:hypothetical protein
MLRSRFLRRSDTWRQILHLDHNELDSLPHGVFHMPHLRVLTLSHNRLQSTCIPEIIDSSSHPVQLQARYQTFLGAFGPVLILPFLLQALVLDHNNLGRIAGGIGAFRQLQVRARITCRSSLTAFVAAAELRTQLHPRPATRALKLLLADRGQLRI